jgi:pyrimidine operon attenuation protein/uracil phosphoribosyltransferase
MQRTGLPGTVRFFIWLPVAADVGRLSFFQLATLQLPTIHSSAMSDSSIILNVQAIQRALTRIAHEIAERNELSGEVVLIGIQRGGVPIAERLSALLANIWGHAIPTGNLDVSMHRDDLGQRAAPDMQPTIIPFDVTGKTVVLVDDVLFSGRTIRAAMDSLNDFGRPKRIQLAVLVDRGHRELPIKADFVGKNVPTAIEEKICVRNDEVILEKKT